MKSIPKTVQVKGKPVKGKLLGFLFILMFLIVLIRYAGKYFLPILIGLFSGKKKEDPWVVKQVEKVSIVTDIAFGIGIGFILLAFAFVVWPIPVVGMIGAITLGIPAVSLIYQGLKDAFNFSGSSALE